MPVAKTYENSEILCTPFDVKGKPYVRIRTRCSRCGGSGHYAYDGKSTICYRCNGAQYEILQVRYYTDSERASLDKATLRRQEQKHKAIEMRKQKWLSTHFNDEGTTTVVVNGNYEKKDALRELGCVYQRGLGWHFPAGSIDVAEFDELGVILSDFDSEELLDGYSFKDERELKSIVENRFPKENTSTSEYQGEVGKRFTSTLKIEKVLGFDGQYGVSYMHLMSDSEGNAFVWTTSSKCLEEREKYIVVGTVKDHRDYKGVKQTVLTRCKVEISKS